MPTLPAIFHSTFQHIFGEQDSFHNVRFTHQGNGVAQMTTNWPKVLQKASIKEGNVCIFTFLNMGQEAMAVHVPIMKH
jgi:hypothetical protein